MSAQSATRPRALTVDEARDPKVVMPMKCRASLRQRLKVAAAEESMTYAELLTSLLDERDRKIERARARQAHPLHRPTNHTQMEAAAP
ncbi:ribbon-helix-helix DNA binding domain protein [Mycobacterium phage Zenteno07]|nr:ribbon-helix-helix DNA binding domain protein [Mycobacterium phage Zenteno07]